MQLSTRASNLKPSATLSIDATAQQLKREGKDIINLSAGQPDFGTPDYIKDAGKEALDKNITKYVPVGGMVEFKEAVVKKYKDDNDLDYDASEVIISTGGKQVLFNALQALVNPGEEVIVPVPYWVSYKPMVELTGGTPVFVETRFEDMFQLTPEKLLESITDKTKVLMMNSPSNPTGSMYSWERLTEIGKICAEKNIFIISDEIYEHLVYGGQVMPSIAALDPAFKDITLTVNGLSKSFAMTGWRIGFGGGPKELIAAMTKYQSHATSNANSIAQYAGVTALGSPQETIKMFKETFEERRDYAYDRLTKMDGIETFKPHGAFYIFPKTSAHYGKSFNGKKIENSFDLCGFLLEEQLIAAVPGAPFGNDEHIRISYSISIADLDKAFTRLEEGLAKLK